MKLITITIRMPFVADATKKLTKYEKEHMQAPKSK